MINVRVQRFPSSETGTLYVKNVRIEKESWVIQWHRNQHKRNAFPNKVNIKFVVAHKTNSKANVDEQ